MERPIGKRLPPLGARLKGWADRLTPRHAATGSAGGQQRGAKPRPWSDYLLWLFRCLAVFQLCKAIVHWAMLFGIGTDLAGAAGPGGQALRAATIYFAVLDPVAGVGLWLTSSWGVVLWLLAAASEIVMLIGFPEIYGQSWILLGIEILSVGTYLWFTFQIAKT